MSINEVNTFASIIENIEEINIGKSYNIIVKNKYNELSNEIISENINLNKCNKNRTYIIDYEEYRRDIDNYLNPIYTPFMLIIKSREILKFLPFAILKD